MKRPALSALVLQGGGALALTSSELHVPFTRKPISLQT